VACEICDDTTWKTITVDGISRVTRCDCVRESASARLLADARIPRRYQHCDFTNYIAYNEHLTRALQHAARVADAFPVVERGLFLQGPPGVGKTHLAVAVLRDVIRNRGARGIFYDTRDLLRVIRSTYDPVNRTQEMDVLRPVIEADLLVLDDLGAEKTSEWVEETLNLIVNSRYSDKRVTVFTSNYDDNPDSTDPDSLLFRIGFRMRSRLHEMCEFLYLDGADYRELPPNGGVDDLITMAKLRSKAARKPTLPSRTVGQARAQLREKERDGRGDLKWSGGKAGSR
jgi:DNA replication protein DnaC